MGCEGGGDLDGVEPRRCGPAPRPGPEGRAQGEESAVKLGRVAVEPYQRLSLREAVPGGGGRGARAEEGRYDMAATGRAAERNSRSSAQA